MIIFCDGASNPKTKRSGIGAVWFNHEQFKDPSDPKSILPDAKPQLILSQEIFGSKTKHINPTNNEAEYESLIGALKLSIEKGLECINIYMDSKLVVNQVCNRWKINFPHLQDLKNIVDTFRDKINFEVFHIRREYNNHADKASKDCISSNVGNKSKIFNKTEVVKKSNPIPKKVSFNPFDNYVQSEQNNQKYINPFEVLMNSKNRTISKQTTFTKNPFE